MKVLLFADVITTIAFSFSYLKTLSVDLAGV